MLREGKWDILAYLQGGAIEGMHFGYPMLGLPYGVPYTLDQAYPFVRDAIIAFVFPILFKPDDVFVQLIAKEAASNADIMFGLFPADSPAKVDMVDLEEKGRVRQIVIQPRRRTCG